MSFHIIGVGSIGSLIATHLRTTLPPMTNVTLMVKRPQYSVQGGSFGPQTAITVFKKGLPMTAKGFKWEIVSDAHRGYSGESAHRSDILRDIVFNNDGTVRSGFGINSLSEEPTEEAEPRKYPMVFKQAAMEFGASAAESSTPISSLIVMVKAPSVLPALRSLRHRLSPSSTIVLLGNGMGVYEEVISGLYRNAADRPHFILGVVTHGAYLREERKVIHATPEGMGSIQWGIVPDWRGRDFERTFWESEADLKERNLELSDIVTPSADESHHSTGSPPDYTSLHHTVRALLGLKALSPKWRPISQIQQIIRQKVAANCVINPLTGLLNVRNGELFAIPHARKLCADLCRESAAVFMQEAQVQGDDPRYVFRPIPMLLAKELENHTVNLARHTAHNQSSMLTDFTRGSTTEIYYLNEYVVRLGREFDIPTPVHETLSALVRMKYHVGHASKSNKR